MVKGWWWGVAGGVWRGGNQLPGESPRGALVGEDAFAVGGVAKRCRAKH